jgi:molybdopterin converting factor small subunit
MQQAPITVTVRFVSQLKDLVGTDEASVELPGGATVAALLDALREPFPALFPTVERAVFLVNARSAAPETVLSDGDRVLVLQVLGGG